MFYGVCCKENQLPRKLYSEIDIKSKNYSSDNGIEIKDWAKLTAILHNLEKLENGSLEKCDQNKQNVVLATEIKEDMRKDVNKQVWRND